MVKVKCAMPHEQCRLGADLPVLGRETVNKPPQSVTHGQRDDRSTVTFPAAGNQRPVTSSTELYCLVTEIKWVRTTCQGSLCTVLQRAALQAVTRVRYSPTSLPLRHTPTVGRSLRRKQFTANKAIKGVKFSHTRYRALGPELIPVYRQSARR